MPSTVKTRFVAFVCFLLILLFVYAATNKLLGLEKFRVQLGQSPLLTRWAGWVAWLVPSVELGLAVLLASDRFRLTALYASFALMVMFSAYIIAITRFSTFIPCSCGGVLQDLSWNQHLFFNIFFVMLSLAAILFHPPMSRTTKVLLQ
jgi:uncharacterized membrane protein YphA (DoxX/SURF4 family)